MNKFLNTLVLALAIFLTGNYLFATPYPTGGAGADLGTANTWTADQTYNDDIALTFGTGGDVDIEFNQTNLVINPQVVGTGHVIITEATGGSGTAPDTGILNLNSSDAGGSGPVLLFHHNSGTPGDSDLPMIISSLAEDSGSTTRIVSQIYATFTDVTATEMDSTLSFVVMQAVNAGNAATIGLLDNAGAWTNASGATSKEYEGQPQDIYGVRILDKIDDLFVSRYHGINDSSPDGIRHFSATAENFWDTFGVGRDPRKLNRDTDGDGVADAPTPGIASMDLAGIALAAIQELHQKVKALEAELSNRGAPYLPPQTNPGPPMPLP